MAKKDLKPNAQDELIDDDFFDDSGISKPAEDIMGGNADYGADDIKVLEGLEAVRKRPGMYIGSTGPRGLHHMIWEIVDNSIDECMAKFATTVKVTITKDEMIRVEDDGRGIPVDKHSKTGKSTVETVLTVLHAGGKFDSESYKVSGGLHGVGASVTNALSDYLFVRVMRQGHIYEQTYRQGGKPQDELHVVGDTDQTGTMIIFKPDFTIMEQASFQKEIVYNRLKQLAYLNKGIKINFVDERDGTNETWQFENGISQYVRDLNHGKKIMQEEVLHSEGEKDGIVVEIAMQYTTSFAPNIYSFCNNINTIEGGTHEEGFRMALTRVISKFAKEYKLLKNHDESISQDDVREGLTAVVSIKHPDPQYEGQTKTKLGNTEVRKIASQVIGKSIERYFLENPEIGKQICMKAVIALEARVAALKARELTRSKSVLNFGSLPGKLADCSSKEAEINEIYVVEGDSAGGSAKLGRNRVFQAILPLRGKVINVEKARIDKVFENNEITSLVTALGCGVAEEFEVEKLRYNRIIIMTDADVDGSHIRTLLLTFLYRYMKPLIEGGHVYIAQPPLFKIQQGKKVNYVYSNAELEEFKTQAGEGARLQFQRYKGLGEMNPRQLWETTMDPSSRILLQVKIEDAIESDQVFSLLMGDDVAPRREFIEENAQYVEGLDI